MIWIVGGTSDTRVLLDKLSEKLGLDNIIVSVTTEYGKKLLADYKVRISEKILDKKEILDFIMENDINKIIDTSHPYAENISANILELIKNQNIEYFRYERKKTEISLGKEFETLESMVEYINVNLKDKNIISTLGTKSLEGLSKIKNNKVYVRFLPTAKSIETAEKYGFLPKQILAIQGPFSENMEKEFLKFYGITHLLTKDSGEAGGTNEKLSASKELGVEVLTLGRPRIEYPNVFEDMDELVEEITKFF